MNDLFAGRTDVGRERSNNEDAFLALAAGHGRALLAVIDGVGGYEGGEVATAIAVRELQSALENGFIADEHSLRSVFARIQQHILDAKRQDPERARMACVLSAVLTDEAKGTFHYAHVGDTRIYLFRDGSLVKISPDHSFVGLLEDSGRISEAEAMAHPKRNEIDRALGFDAAFHADQYIASGASPFLPGDLLLLCSDGLTDLVDRAGISAVLQGAGTLEQKAKALVDEANGRGGKDNITVVLCTHSRQRFAGAPVGQPRSASVEIRDEPRGVAPAPPATTPVRRKAWWPWIAAVLLLALFFGWWLARRQLENTAVEPPMAVAPAGPDFGAQVALLQDSFRLADDSLYQLPDSLFIGQDSLQLFGGSGSILAPAAGRSVWQVAPTLRLLRLGHLELRETDLRISSSNVAALRFDSVRLVNVTVGVGTPVTFRDTVVSGSLYLVAPAKGGKHP